ncbi:hypothetical protein [Xenorhabdus siamensis]|uniref:hypothetical protein n=1 Tax=Xenorhabdus siamensis TaxID=3136254 RepID=UPI0030F3CFB1
MITDITGEAFSLNTRNSTDLERNLNRVEQAFKQGNLRWCNSPVWMEDMDYQLVYASDTYQTGTEDKRWITSSTQSPFPAMIEVNDEITLKYVITPDGPASKILANSDSEPTDYELKAQVVEFDRIKGRILIKKILGPTI